LIAEFNCTGHNCNRLILYRSRIGSNSWDVRTTTANSIHERLTKTPAAPPDAAAIARSLCNSIALQPGQLWSIVRARAGLSIICVTGQIWITQTGDRRDHVLEAGRCFQTSGTGGKIVVQALTRANVSFASSPIDLNHEDTKSTNNRRM
jgi:hypothetical protein